jgi:hypothetical protein
MTPPAFDSKTFQDEIDRLGALAATSTDTCTVAKYIALSDKRVRDLIEKKHNDGFIFRGIYCAGGIGIPELIDVVFDFDCPHGRICLVDPSFAAVVNIAHRTVVAIVDPYIPPSYSGAASEPRSTYGERTYLVLANHTFRDIHIQVTKDVHTGNWGPKQINHNSDPEVKSKRIDFGNKATYGIKVWNNNGGQPGDFIGEFDHGVRYNAAGNSDRLEFAIVDVGGRTHLRAYSIRQVAEVALWLWLGG